MHSILCEEGQLRYMKRTKQRTAQPVALRERQTQALIVPANESSNSGGGSFDESLSEELDPVLQPPLWMFILGAIEVVWGLTTNVLQAGTSFTGILGWQQTDTLSIYGLAEGTQILLARNMGFTIVALVLGVGA